MKRTQQHRSILARGGTPFATTLSLSLVLVACGGPVDAPDDLDITLAETDAESSALNRGQATRIVNAFADRFNINRGSRNLHLEDSLNFKPVAPSADADRGRALFGLAPDLETSDPSGALFEGASQVFGGTVVSNGRTCFTCHRGQSEHLGLPAGRVVDSVPLSDPLFTGIEADAQGDPDAFHNLSELGLLKYRPNRFNPQRPQSDPFRKVFGWRKSVRLVNTGFAHGFLTDGRGRVLFEAARGAAFSHTQSSDERFDDLFSVADGQDIEAFLFGDATLSDPRLAALRDPSHPLHEEITTRPFYTVPVTTRAQARGKRVFKRQCFTCHDMPNVFSSRAHVDALGNGDRPDNFPPWAPAVGKLFNIGVSERNAHGLRFSEPDGNGGFQPIVIPLVDGDGTVHQYTLDMDIGLAGTTGRWEDRGRFKVPQLRDLVELAPYFHDNSAATIEEVVDYFNSDAYNDSLDGRRYPVRLNARQRADLIEFLKIL